MTAQTTATASHHIEHDRWMTDPMDVDYLAPADRWCRVCGKLDSEHGVVQVVVATKCGICNETNGEHMLSCPTRWYR